VVLAPGDSEATAPCSSLEQSLRSRTGSWKWLVPVIQLLGRWRQVDLVFKASLGKVKKILSQKQKQTNKKAGGMVHVVELLPSLQETLGSISSTTRNQNGTRR
jgi:hypothetical protein